MVHERMLNLLIRLRDALCVLSLIFFVVLEGYTATVLITEHSEFSTSSEHAFGWLLVLLDCASCLIVLWCSDWLSWSARGEEDSDSIPLQRACRCTRCGSVGTTLTGPASIA